MHNMLSTAPFQIPKYLLNRVKNKNAVRMAIAGADHLTALESARQSSRANLIEPVLIGNKKKIQDLADSLKWDITQFEIIHANGESPSADAAVSLAKNREVKAIMKGQIHTDTL